MFGVKRKFYVVSLRYDRVSLRLGKPYLAPGSSHAAPRAKAMAEVWPALKERVRDQIHDFANEQNDLRVQVNLKAFPRSPQLLMECSEAFAEALKKENKPDISSIVLRDAFDQGSKPFSSPSWWQSSLMRFKLE